MKENNDYAILELVRVLENKKADIGNDVADIEITSQTIIYGHDNPFDYSGEIDKEYSLKIVPLDFQSLKFIFRIVDISDKKKTCQISNLKIDLYREGVLNVSEDMLDSVKDIILTVLEKSIESMREKEKILECKIMDKLGELTESERFIK